MADRQKPRLLSLDGGGARGWTQLELLKQIIYLLKVKMGYEGEDIEEYNLYPCEFFDLITGSGTGGVNGIMTGRLGMSIAQCRKAWDGLSEALLVQPSNGKLLDAEKLENWAKALVKEYTGDENTLMFVSGKPQEQNFNGRSCRTSVTAMRAQNIGMSTMFRSYRVRANQEYNCCIWEAIRATTSSPVLYKPIFIGRSWSKQEFINAELGANNPVVATIEEKSKIWLRQGNWPPPEIGCVVSIGSGKGQLICLPDSSSDSSSLIVSGLSVLYRCVVQRETPRTAKEKELYDVMLRIAKDCERKHQEIKSSCRRDEDVYFRFSVEDGMMDIEEHNYDNESRVKMNAQTMNYVTHADFEIQFGDVVRKLDQLSTDYPRKHREVPMEVESAPPPYSKDEKAGFFGLT